MHAIPNAAAAPAEAADLTVIGEAHASHLEFNVMADRPVRESLHVREYRVGDRYAEALFDREYRSSMQKSPSHLIFLSVLVHTQKLLYMALCREFGLDYDPDGPEQFKMWPTKLDIRIPTLIAAEQDLVQRLWIHDVRPVREGVYKVAIETRVGSMQLRCEVPTFLIAAADIGAA